MLQASTTLKKQDNKKSKVKKGRGRPLGSKNKNNKDVVFNAEMTQANQC